MKLYPVMEDLVRPSLQVAMPRAGRPYAPGGTGFDRSNPYAASRTIRTPVLT